MKLINIGFGNMVNADRVIAVVSPDSAPIKRILIMWCFQLSSRKKF